LVRAIARSAHLKEVSKRTTFVRVSAQTNDVFGG
jgi:hypothetical protein